MRGGVGVMVVPVVLVFWVWLRLVSVVLIGRAIAGIMSNNTDSMKTNKKELSFLRR